MRHCVRSLSVAVLAGLGIVLAGCRGADAPAPAPVPDTGRPPAVAVADAGWSQVISATTSGLVARRSAVRVQFAADVVPAARVGQPAAGLLTLEPAVAGQLDFANPRELVLVPAAPLQPGQYYKAVLKNDGLAGVPATLQRYEFFFRVIEREFEVELAGLQATRPAGTMQLSGHLQTSDEETGADVERLLTARGPEGALPLSWQHDGDGRRHAFTIAGLKRRSEPTALTLAWDGAPLGSTTRGQTQLELPALDQFRATAARLAGGEGRDGRAIELQFSDDLAREQDLRGLISLSSGAFRARVQGSTVRLYPEAAGAAETLQVFVQPGVRSAAGAVLAAQAQFSVALPAEKPRVRFVGKGVILPGADAQSVPFEAVNARSVQITAFRIYPANMGVFLQGNGLAGEHELGRVGRYLWRRTVQLPPAERHRWARHHLDIGELFKTHPDGMFRLTLSLARGDAVLDCPNAEPGTDLEPAPPASADDLDRVDGSGWDFVDESYAGGSDTAWQQRTDPCKNAYYLYDTGTRDARNFLASDIGLLAKGDALGRLTVAATSLRSAQPLAGTRLTLMNFQNQPIASAETGADGLATIEPPGKPFYLLAEKDRGRGYLKLSDGAALPVSHFDVGGEAVQAGLKGMIYGERGVWRPGDDIHLFFLLQDPQRRLPPDHPVTMELVDPRGRVMLTRTSGAAVGGFHRFTLGTAADAPTGNWTARATVGGSRFVKTVKVEAVMPNRLKVDLDLGGDGLQRADQPLRGSLASQWLTGASAAGLKADVRARFSPVPTRFERYTDFAFDDPTRRFGGEAVTLFEGPLDDAGRARFEHLLKPEQPPPGWLSGRITSRVFERGGAFSISQTRQTYSPYARYVGLKLPKGDATRQMLLTDTAHTVEVASLDWQGKPAAAPDIELSLHKLEWKWWWDQSAGNDATFASSDHGFQVQSGQVATRTDGPGRWQFTIKYPEWGRFLLRACDKGSGHCAGQIFYADWPGWAGRAQEQAGPAASVLNFASDKPRYTVGETARITLPEASQGRALLTVENGSRVLHSRWVELDGQRRPIELPVTAAMAPNVYVAVTLLQPHAGKDNDRPIRLYGVIPLAVQDPATVLQPQLQTDAVWVPESKGVVQVSEARGRPMSYTVAVVDEGLLGLTAYKTPNPHAHFHQREALGVRSWDLFDDVAGAYGGRLERVLAIGGSDDALVDDDVQRKRFPPVVTVLGPFRLAANATARHEIVLPPYIGAVRVMVVAASDGETLAYGAADTAVPVRQPLMLLPTLPRLVGPGEQITVPVSVFALEPDVKRVRLKLEAEAPFELAGPAEVTLDFERPEEKLALLKLKAGARPGQGRLRFTAVSGTHRAQAQVDLVVRSPNPATAEVQRRRLEPGERWTADVRPHGLPGTNDTRLEVSSVPPLDLERRLQSLIRYPHGCLEQTTSAALPQLYMPALVQLPDDTRRQTEDHVRGAIARLRHFQGGSGGFVYWPGAYDNAYNSWTSSYVGHFLAEAERLGYAVPAAMRDGWAAHQRAAARAWSGPPAQALDQAYRLFTLAQAGRAEVAAMNRLRETPGLPALARWQLAAAYQLAGLPDIAREVAGPALPPATERGPETSFASPLRDRALLLQAAVILQRREAADALAQQVSDELASDGWQHTHALAFALMAMARYVGDTPAGAFGFEQQLGSAAAERIAAAKPLHSATLAVGDAGAPLVLTNTGERRLYASVIVHGVPPAGAETDASAGLALKVLYTDLRSGEPVDPARLRQGQDVRVSVTVSNTTNAPLANIALTQMLPAGWEIHNERVADDAAAAAPQAAAPALDHEDIRDDRVLRYFSLGPRESRILHTTVNAAYLGRYYQPALSADAMYDATRHARLKGRWVEVVVP